MQKQIFTFLLIAALLIAAFIFLITSTPKNKQMKFIMEADTLEYKCSIVRSPAAKNPLILCRNNEQVRKFLGDFKLTSKDACQCAHMDILIFHNGKESLTVSICDHCFDILVKPAQNGQPPIVDHYKMQDGLYQRFKAFQVDWESQLQKANNNSMNIETN